MRETTFRFIEAQGRATRRVLLEALAFKAVFGRLPRAACEDGTGRGTPADTHGEHLCQEGTNVCAEGTKNCADTKDACIDAKNICAESKGNSTPQAARRATAGEVEGLRARHVAMLRLIVAYERAADEAGGDYADSGRGTLAGTASSDGEHKEEKRRKESEKENVPSPRTPLPLKEKESEKKETPAEETTQEENAAQAAQDGAQAQDGQCAATSGEALETDTPTVPSPSAPSARRKPGRKPAARAALRLTREQLADGDRLAERLPFIDPRHAPTLARWLRYKQERGQAYKSEDSLRACYDHYLGLCHGDPGTGAAIVERSVANNWSGLFAPEAERGKPRFMTHDEQRELDRARRERQAGELVRELLATNRPCEDGGDGGDFDLGLFGIGNEGG